MKAKRRHEGEGGRSKDVMTRVNEDELNTRGTSNCEGKM